MIHIETNNTRRFTNTRLFYLTFTVFAWNSPAIQFASGPHSFNWSVPPLNRVYYSHSSTMCARNNLYNF